MASKHTAYRDKGLVWLFRRNRAGRFVPAPGSLPEGFPKRYAKQLLKELREGEHSGEGNPAGALYIACECQYVETNL